MSTVIVNTLTGTTTAGSISVTGEGNSTTTNLQQGLLKSWVDIPADGASLNDSFNIGSSTDSGAGDRRVAYTSNMATANYVITVAVDDSNASTSVVVTDISNGTKATTGFDAEVCIASSSSNRQNYDIESYYMIAGDLA
jgi:hypothetical protein